MDPLTVVLMLSAALLHASWHGLVKAGSDQVINLAGMGLVATVVALMALPFVAAPPAAIWPLFALSVLLHGGYKLFLARAYEFGDLVHAFPLARGIVPLSATVIAFVVFGQLPGAGQLAGIGCVSCGVLLLAARGIRGRLNGEIALAAFGAGTAVACYTVVDAYGTRLYGDWAGFTAWLIVLDSLCFLGVTRYLRGKGLWEAMVRERTRLVVSGGLGVASFTVFLWALSRNPVGPVSALRETSVLFAMMIGALVYREHLTRLRLAAGVAIVAGIFIIAVWR